ncbi:unnamed protein product [Tilletia controversa]|uniref:D-isomer specific 2-hydroxyacid dehydrogenase NAD-binding domain-containing protein n=3 Tax=Tilletia TaxID=13289 RepID=A0A8X7SXV0_9BASI|nr:hypothetical protein CF336_g3052 [Tilletia laevis]KAE8200887.1 hypothetical protein CF328_g2835 [Tilletia controversa]KAE8262279.1 hypothetical protein A4X03_0g2582 [Tilletia caries]KAE8205622.1 hypothetical protein CF335_g2237 [Tilletia laevis]KAE8248692.1 hypothetical protein A4X06_0g3568 [Tilletia controversa]
MSSKNQQHLTFQSWRGGSQSGAKDLQPGPVAIVTDGKAYTTWAPGFKDEILSRVPEADVRLEIDVSELASRAVGAEGVVGVVWLSHSPAGLSEALGAEGSKIRWVQLPSAGIEKHAAVILAHPDIIWTTAKGAFAEPVAEHGLALTLALMRYIPARVIATSWGPSAGISLFRSNVVILGAGGIALAYLSLLSPFRCTTQLVRRNASDPLDLPSNVDPSTVSVHAFDKLDDLLPTADVLFLACALTAETKGLVNQRTLKLLPKHGIIVNVGRGGLIVTDALVEALRSGEVGGAGLDVTDPEPLPESHPLFSLTTDSGAEEHESGSEANAARLVRQRANVIITPHTADTPEMVRPLLEQRAAANVKALYERSGRFEGLIRIDGEHVY